MEDNKYYIPTVEEFYVGFEFEINIRTHTSYKDFTDSWGKVILGTKSPQNDLFIGEFIKNYKVDLSNCRVKYLDREDIESLGWNCETTGYYTLITKYQNLTLRHMEGNVYSWVGIYSKHDLSGINVLFDGSIRNKSELKRIMKHLILKYNE